MGKRVIANRGDLFKYLITVDLSGGLAVNQNKIINIIFYKCNSDVCLMEIIW